MTPILIDTNLLVYLFDQNQPDRQSRAVDVLNRLELIGAGRLSVQNLAEFFSVSTRKLSPPFSPTHALRKLSTFTRAWQVCDLTSLIILEAFPGVRD